MDGLAPCNGWELSFPSAHHGCEAKGIIVRHNPQEAVSHCSPRLQFVRREELW